MKKEFIKGILIHLGTNLWWLWVAIGGAGLLLLIIIIVIIIVIIFCFCKNKHKEKFYPMNDNNTFQVGNTTIDCNVDVDYLESFINSSFVDQ